MSPIFKIHVYSAYQKPIEQQLASEFEYPPQKETLENHYNLVKIVA